MELKNITHDRRQEIYLKIFYLFAFTIPISSYVSIRLLIIILFLSFFVKGHFKNIRSHVWDILLYLLVLVAGLLYSKDIQTGLRVLETNFSFLAIPLVFGRLQALDNKKRNAIFLAFLLGLIVSSAICLFFATYRYTQEPDIKFFFSDHFTEIINSHPTYFAYYLILSISVELYVLYHNERKSNPLLWYLLILFLFLVLILTGGQTAFISLLFVFSFFILKFITEEKSTRRKGVIGLIALMLCCMFSITIFEKGNHALALNDSWERAILWESALAAVPNPLIGVGTGDYKIALNEYYTTHNLNQFAIDSYNAHNQLIQLLFSNGILGVLSFCIMLGRPLYLSVKNKNILAILCLFPFLIYGITEVFLGRYQGVVFFALLHQIFIAEIYQEKSTLLANVN